MVADQKQGLTLQGHMRRLSRKLYSMRRRTGFTASRRRGSPLVPMSINPMSWFSARRRTSALPAEARRRMVAPTGLAARRRGSYMGSAGGMSSMSRRRSYTSGSTGYSNPYSSYMGAYGYPSPSYASQSFGGHMPITTSYGYSGANAYSGNMPIALAAGAGLLAGYSGSHLLHHHSHWGGYSRDDMYKMPCTSGRACLPRPPPVQETRDVDCLHRFRCAIPREQHFSTSLHK